MNTMNVDFQKIAHTLVQRQLRIRPGELVRITGGLHAAEFIEEIGIETRKVGAFPLMDLLWDRFVLRQLEDTPTEFLARPLEHSAQIEALVDCQITLPLLEDPRVLETASPKKLTALTRARQVVQEARLKRNARRIGIGFPTQADSSIFGVDFGWYRELFWRAVQADTERVLSLCHKIRARLNGADRVLIRSPEGDELRLSIRGRRINMDDGVISDEDVEAGDITANLPFGEVYAAPIEETVEGVARYPVVFYQGIQIRDLRLEFRDGRLVESSARTNHNVFLDALEPHRGNKDRLGEVGIGTNHEVLEPSGSTLLDEKIFGSVHLALGENRSYGGTNASSCHWDMVMLNPTVEVDDRLILRDGTFVV